MKLLCSSIVLLVVATLTPLGVVDALSFANHRPLIATTTSSSALWRNSLFLGRHTSIHQQSTTSRLFVSSPSSIDSTNIQPTLSNNENQTNNDADDDTSPEREHYDAVIVGGGPAGLLSAIMLAQRQRRHQQPTSTTSSSVSGRRRIIVYDRLPPPPPPNDPIYSVQSSKYYLLGIGHRGQSSLKHFDVWKYVEDASVAVFGRRGWEPGLTNEEDGKITLSNKEVTSRILPRDKLVSVLKTIIEDKYMDIIDVRYGFQVDPISFGNDYDKGEEEGCDGPPVALQVSRCIPVTSSSGEVGEECSIENDDDDASASTQIIQTNFLIGADGAARTIANAMEERSINDGDNVLKRLFGNKKFKVVRYTDDNPRVYKSVPITFPKHWPHDLNYSARSMKSRVTFEALPSDNKGNYCALLLMKPDDTLASANCNPNELRQFFQEQFPQFSKLINDDVMSDVAKKSSSALPSFRYASGRLHEGSRTVLLGDSIHTVKPYFGLGANTALEDVQILDEILDTTSNLSGAVEEFTKQRANDSRALVNISRGIDRPGKLGTLQFILPLILDSIFHKRFPLIFGPSIFGMFQKQNITFTGIQRRKRLDRMMQSIVIGSVLSAVAVAMRSLIKVMAKALGVRDVVVSGCLVALVGVVAAVKKMPRLERNDDDKAAGDLRE